MLDKCESCNKKSNGMTVIQLHGFTTTGALQISKQIRDALIEEGVKDKVRLELVNSEMSVTQYEHNDESFFDTAPYICILSEYAFLRDDLKKLLKKSFPKIDCIAIKGK